MTATLPQPATRRRRPVRREWQAELVARLKAELEPTRSCLCIGPHLIGWFDDEPLDQVVTELVRWAADPGHLESLGWPHCCAIWPWTPGEDVSIWRDCRLLALVTLDRTGKAIVHRFD